MIEAIKRYLDVFENASGSEAERLKALATTLDDLLVAYDRTSGAVFDEQDYPDPPQLERSELRATAERRFPEVGYYADTWPVEPTKAEVVVCDAIDDLADIAKDLSEVLWRWENTSKVDAIWYFRFLFESHWGRHLLNLRSYIYFKQFEH